MIVAAQALKLVERFDPLNAAYYSYYKRDFDNARRIVRGYLTDPSPKDDADWAGNLLGLLEYARYRNDLGGRRRAWTRRSRSCASCARASRSSRPGSTVSPMS